MGATEWVLLIVVVILIPLAIAVAVTLWSLEQARQRNRKNRPGQVRRVAAPSANRANSGGGDSSNDGGPTSEPIQVGVGESDGNSRA